MLFRTLSLNKVLRVLEIVVSVNSGYAVWTVSWLFQAEQVISEIAESKDICLLQ